MAVSVGLVCSLLTWLVTAARCNPDCPPPPTNLSYEWLDALTVRVSWTKPLGQQGDTKLQYKYRLQEGEQSERLQCSSQTFFEDVCLTERMVNGTCLYDVRTLGSESCNGCNERTGAHVTVRSRKPPDDLVKDLKCFIYPKCLNCSWIPIDPSVHLNISYRKCGFTEQTRRSWKSCSDQYGSRTRSGCVLHKASDEVDIYIHLESDTAMRTFKAALMVDSPKMTISEEKGVLRLTWVPPEVGRGCAWNYTACYSRCKRPEECQSSGSKGGHTMDVAYENNCLYQIRSRVQSTVYCPPISSDYSQSVTYGADELPDGTLTVVAIVVPIILSVCVLLSCYCLRRHRAIICPVIPDPSVIFKEMMMNGNKELKTTAGSVYTPVPEPIEPCRVTVVPEVCHVQQNS